MKPMIWWSLEIKTWCFNNGTAFSAERKVNSELNFDLKIKSQDWIVDLENCNMILSLINDINKLKSTIYIKTLL